MATAAPATPTYLDDSGNPMATPPQAAQAQSGPTYLDDSGNPVQQAASNPIADAMKPQVAPPAPAEGYATHYLKSVIDQTKQQWASGQQWRDQEAQVAKNVTDSVKKGDFGSAAEMLISHLTHGASSLASGVASNVKANLTEADPNHGQLYANPIAPMPGVSDALGDFADSEAAAPPAAASPGSTGVMQKVKQAVSPKAATQPGAQTALREGAAASAQDAGAGELAIDPKSSIRTMMDKPIAEASKVEDKLYSTVNDAAQTDMKSLYDRREELQDAIEDPTNIAQKTSIQKELATTDQAISQGEANVQSKLGKNASDLIQKAKAATQQRYSMEEGAKKLFNNESVVSGNLAHGAPESINVNSAIKQAENLDKPSKFAPRGSPTRLQQMFGEDGAQALKQGLYEAQKAGQKVANRNSVLAWLGGTATAAGTAYELLSK